MGGIRRDFGRISIESRSQSFIIHANYGYETGKKAVGDLDFETDFIAALPERPEDRRIWRIRSKMADHVNAAETQFSSLCDFPNELLVEVPGFEVPAEGGFAEIWREWHPEFANEDLDDLIAALQELRENPR